MLCVACGFQKLAGISHVLMIAATKLSYQLYILRLTPDLINNQQSLFLYHNMDFKLLL